MNRKKFLFICIYFLLIFLIKINGQEIFKDSIPLKYIKSLTFYKDKKTNYKKSLPLQQLICQGNFCDKYQPNVVNCINQGVDNNEIVQWICNAEMPKQYSFGKIEVSCEGYDNKFHNFVLKDSCALLYELLDSERNFNTAPTLNNKNHMDQVIQEYYHEYNFIWFFIFIIIIIFFIFLCVYHRCFLMREFGFEYYNRKTIIPETYKVIMVDDSNNKQIN